jgi:hypothetical protein
MKDMLMAAVLIDLIEKKKKSAFRSYHASNKTTQHFA